MIVAIASGKGGTGKTLLATGLAWALVARGDANVRLLDCDVEAPNAHLFLRPEYTEVEKVHLLVPSVDPERCTLCGRCAEVCAFNALAVLRDRVLLFAELCHGCGSCTLQCPEGAITEEPRHLGVVEVGRAGVDRRLMFARGVMDVGQALATPVIRALKNRALPTSSGALALLDAPPGNACPMVDTLSGSDVALLVTEPTPFGLHDLEIAVSVARDELGIPVGVVVNREGLGDDAVDRFCEQAGVPILMRIPFDRRIAEVTSDGGLWPEQLPEYRQPLLDLYEAVAAIAEAHR